MQEKKFLMPKMAELRKMQDMKANIYKYLLIKAIESLAIERKNNPNSEFLKTAYERFEEDPYISHAICKLNPSEIIFFDIARSDVKLCQEYLKRRKETSDIYNLDILSQFHVDVTYNLSIMYDILSILSEGLPICPNYRFEYRQSQILDNIFGGEFHLDIIPKRCWQEIVRQLVNIEPYYALLLKDTLQMTMDESAIARYLHHGIDSCANRYDIDEQVGREFLGKDILTKQPTKVKKLLWCINNGNKY